MNAEKYHFSLRPLEEACRLSQTDWVCLPNPLTGWGEEGSKVWKLRILLRHIGLIFRCWRAASHRHILIREFSTLPLMMVFPLLWPLRCKLFFLIHHNLQWAMRSRMERFGMTALARMGVRLAAFETQDFPNLGKLGVPSSRNLVLPHPVARTFSNPRKKGETPVIGVAGIYRPEKGIDELIRCLKENFPMFGILLGVPNPEAAVHLNVETCSTASEEDYRAMIARCDVLVQNGAADSYFYRASGVIADAAACGTAVVAPDFPILGKQVEGIGEVFQSLEEMPAAVSAALENARGGRYDFTLYCNSRSAQALAEKLDEFTHG